MQQRSFYDPPKVLSLPQRRQQCRSAGEPAWVSDMGCPLPTPPVKSDPKRTQGSTLTGAAVLVDEPLASG